MTETWASCQIQRVHTQRDNKAGELITFNRQCRDQVPKLKVDDYFQRKNPDTSMDASHALNTTETRLCKIFATVEVEGKLGHTAPEPLQQKTEAALLATACQMCWVLLLHNQYVFATLHSDLRDCDALHNVRHRRGVQHTWQLKSTAMRHQVAILFQILNLRENEHDPLAQYMGHDVCSLELLSTTWWYSAVSDTTEHFPVNGGWITNSAVWHSIETTDSPNFYQRLI